MDYRNKYIKYKRKYLNLTKKKQIKGGVTNFLSFIYMQLFNFFNKNNKTNKTITYHKKELRKETDKEELKYWIENLEERREKKEQEEKIRYDNRKIREQEEEKERLKRNESENKRTRRKEQMKNLKKEQTSNKKSMIEELKLKQKIKKLEDFKMVDSVKYLENIQNYRQKLGHEDNIILEESLLTVMKKILIGNKFRIVQGKEFSQHKLLSWLPDLHYIVEIIGEDNKLYTFGLWVKSDNVAYIMFPDFEYLKCSKRFEECVKETGENRLYRADEKSNLDDIENQVDCNKVCRGLEGINEDNNLKFEVVYDYEELNYYQLMIIYFIILNAKLDTRYQEKKNLDDEDNFFYWKTHLNLPFSFLSFITNSCSFVSGSNISDINCQTFGYGFKNTPEYTLKVLLAAHINNDNIVDDIMLKLKNIENNFDNSDYYLEEIIKLLGIERNKINELKVKEAKEKIEKEVRDTKPKPKPKLILMKKKPSSKITKPKRETSPGKDRFKPQTQYEIYHKIAPRKLTDEEIIIFDEKEEKIEKLHEDFYTNEEGINNIMVSETLGMTLEDKKTKLDKLRKETKKKEKLIMTEYYEKMQAESLGMTLEEYRKHIAAKAESLGMTVEEYKKMEIEAGTLGMRVEEYMDYKAAESLGITVEKYKKNIKTPAELMEMTVEDYIKMMGVN